MYDMREKYQYTNLIYLRCTLCLVVASVSAVGCACKAINSLLGHSAFLSVVVCSPTSDMVCFIGYVQIPGPIRSRQRACFCRQLLPLFLQESVYQQTNLHWISAGRSLLGVSQPSSQQQAYPPLLARGPTRIERVFEVEIQVTYKSLGLLVVGGEPVSVDLCHCLLGVCWRTSRHHVVDKLALDISEPQSTRSQSAFLSTVGLPTSTSAWTDSYRESI